ncbi:MAG: sulfotransferase [Methylohalobius sp.]|nr:sulfotransferase [Methylohalobius sp.]
MAQDGNVLPLLLRGQAALQRQALAEASEWFARAVLAAPKHAQARACLGQALCWQGKRSEGLAQLHESGRLLAAQARRDQAQLNLLLELIDQLQFWNDYSGALALSQQAVQIASRHVRAWQLLALSYSNLNRPKPALQAVQQAVALAPNNAIIQILAASIEADNKLWEAARRRLEKVLASSALQPEEAMRAHKELARVLDRLGEYERAFTELQAAEEAALKLPALQRQDSNLVFDLLETYRNKLDRALIGRWAKARFADRAPVFLVGFFRSGTTLTQQVLASHPRALVLDEADLLAPLRAELKRLTGRESLPEQLRALKLEDVKRLRAFYWTQARWRYGDQIDQAPVVVDKTTFNFIDLGFLNHLFPDAKAVVMVRDPRDVCLSCYMQLFKPNPSTVHLFSWPGTARLYAAVMAWWQELKPRLTFPWREIGYEQAVLDFTPTYQELLAFLGLEWDPKVVEFHRLASGQFIASPSAKQVAEPLSAASIGRWRRYERAFAPILSLLKPAITALGYEALSGNFDKI